MSATVITTLHSDGYELYGKKNIASWVDFFPTDWSIMYYAEKHNPIFDKRVDILDFNESCPDWQIFYEFVKNQTKDITDTKKLNWYKKAIRWSFKMFALMHAIKNTSTRYLIWLDADVLAVKEPPNDWLESCLDSQCLAGQLEFIKAGGHVETGILIIDLHHRDLNKLYDWIKLGYVDLKILEEEKAWDGIWIAKLVQSNTIAWNNLSMTYKSKTAQAFSNKQLHWLTHKVGKFKFRNTEISARSGRSPGNELI